MKIIAKVGMQLFLGNDGDKRSGKMFYNPEGLTIEELSIIIAILEDLKLDALLRLRNLNEQNPEIIYSSDFKEDNEEPR